MTGENERMNLQEIVQKTLQTQKCRGERKRFPNFEKPGTEDLTYSIRVKKT